MEELKALAKKLLRELSSIPEEKMRQSFLATKLSGLEAEEIARLLAALYSSGRSIKETARLKTMLVNPEGLRKVLGEKKYRSTQRASVELGLKKVSRLFTDLPPHRTGLAGYDKEEEAGMEFITLGERRSLSKGRIKDTLDRLLSDPDPTVIGNILDNPRMTEREILKIASKRPGSPAILKLLATHKKWSRRYSVRRALVLNWPERWA